LLGVDRAEDFEGEEQEHPIGRGNWPSITLRAVTDQDELVAYVLPMMLFDDVDETRIDTEGRTG